MHRKGIRVSGDYERVLFCLFVQDRLAQDAAGMCVSFLAGEMPLDHAPYRLSHDRLQQLTNMRHDRCACVMPSSKQTTPRTWIRSRATHPPSAATNTTYVTPSSQTHVVLRQLGFQKKTASEWSVCMCVCVCVCVRACSHLILIIG